MNTLFFATIHPPVQVKEQFFQGKILSYHHKSVPNLNTVNRKFAKSLLRFVIENIFADSPAADTKDTMQEEVHKVEYISTQYACLFFIPYLQEMPAMQTVQHSSTSPFLEMLTPPPKV